MGKYISKNILLSKQMEHKTWKKKTIEVVEGFLLFLFLIFFFTFFFKAFVSYWARKIHSITGYKIMGLKKIRPFTFLHKQLVFWSSLHGLGLRPIFYLLHGLDFKAQKYKRVHHRRSSSHKCLMTHKQCLAQLNRFDHFMHISISFSIKTLYSYCFSFFLFSFSFFELKCQKH